MQGQQQMNYTGSTHCTRFLLAALPKSYYEGSDKTFKAMLDFLSRDIGKLSKVGITGPDGLQYYVAVVSCKGDWPFLHKIGGLTRSFYNQPKQAEAKNPCVGICHLCLAGRPGIPFEDVSGACEWQYTLGIEPPWKEVPIALNHLTHDPSFPELFFHPDPWHSWHLGEGRSLACNAIKLLLEITPGRNADLRIEFLFKEYQSFCRETRIQCYCTKFSENLFGLSANDFPSGGWTKGNFTTSLIRWLASYLQKSRNLFSPGSLLELTVPLLHVNWSSFFFLCCLFVFGSLCYWALVLPHFIQPSSKANATVEIDLCFRKMYVAPLWIPAAKAREIAGHGLKYLETFQAMARKAKEEGRALFLFNSKIHMNDHIFRNLAWDAEMAELSLNPLAWGVQLDEDLIGKAARLTRHVSSKPVFTIRRTLQRWLIAAHCAWSNAGMLKRIWHPFWKRLRCDWVELGTVCVYNMVYTQILFMVYSIICTYIILYISCWNLTKSPQVQNQVLTWHPWNAGTKWWTLIFSGSKLKGYI